MNFLPSPSIEAIKAHDLMIWTGNNRTRFYKYLLPAGSDMEVHTVAVKANKTQGSRVVKEVVRASVDDPWMYLKDIMFEMLCGYMVDWSPEGLGPKKSWAYKGNWVTELYRHSSSLWKLSNYPVINPEALLEHPRFQWCAWTPDCGDVLDFLKVYKQHPRVELLAKTSAKWLCTRISLISHIERDKALMRFFLTNLADIEKYHYGVDAIQLAHKRGWTLSQAARQIACKREFRGLSFPRALDAVRAAKYIKRQKTTKQAYCNYLHHCSTLRLNLSDTKTAFPHRFKNRAAVVMDQVSEIERRKKAELAKQMDAELAAIAAKAKKKLVQARSKTFKIVVPTRSADFIREGERMKNCLGDGHYAGKMVRGEVFIAFIRKATRPNVSFVAVEYDLRQKRVSQCYGANNSKPPKPVLQFVNRLFSKSLTKGLHK